jgi:hypothetical protein
MYAPPMMVPLVLIARAADTGSAYVIRSQFPPWTISCGGEGPEDGSCGCVEEKCSKIGP